MDTKKRVNLLNSASISLKSSSLRPWIVFKYGATAVFPTTHLVRLAVVKSPSPYDDDGEGPGDSDSPMLSYSLRYCMEMVSARLIASRSKAALNITNP